ncbi:hypothetical protein GCM10025783_28160 [Amnibacterium soli]|uniref:Glycosyltransferase 2-like domain-containing protein n=1 Tax=Amnibacterium soli TaxID=1282736 RepID=A0ABP8ZDR7_9MICO
MVETPSLVVAVLTFRRPQDLAALLPLLTAQLVAVGDLHPLARVLVVDNSPEAGARDLVARTPGPVDYAHEPVAGIAAARNRALDEARSDDLLVFIDDDERPTEGWLRALLGERSRSDAVVVAGPVVSSFAVPPGPFVAAGRFFDRRRLPTGSPIDVAATNNLLLDLRKVRGLGLRFDPATGATGGEDTLFTRSVHARGGRMTWCDEAVVHDIVPAARITPRWVLLRALSSGNSWSLTSLQLAEGLPAQLRTRLALHALGLIRIAGGTAQAAVGALLGRPYHRARGVRTAARGAGMLLGAWNVRYREYRRPSANR